jgi:mycothiol synthase
MNLPQLELDRDSLDGLPEVALPPGYRIRSYRPGDAAAWCRLVNEGIGPGWTEEKFEAEMARAVRFSPEDLLFAEVGGELVGTAWALRHWERPEEVGYVHMVAVAPAHRGRGLGRALTTAVLRRFREMGLTRATLRTDDHRLAAIKLYLSLGFRPTFSHPSHEARWRCIQARLARTEEAAG